LGVEVFPFTKLSYKSKAIEQKWEPLRRRIYGAVSYAEYEMVKQGYRHCDVYDFGPSNIMHRLKKVARDGLIFIPILISQQYGGYGHRHYVVDKFSDDTFIYGGVARTAEDAIYFHDAGVVTIKERLGDYGNLKFDIGDETFSMNPNGIDHEVTGALLGYPACDRKFFRDTWLRDGCLDPMYEMAANTENHQAITQHHIQVTGVPLLNRLCRYWGFNIIPHFPHSFDCKESQRFADIFFKLMKDCDEEASNACKEVLNMPMKWSMKNCITIVDHPLFIGSANGYYTKEERTVEWFPQ